ncbi:MAG: N-acetylglucosamine-specific PTS transporter subunit IIBC [Succinivibrionaceae bacterium]|nr:N-acetylglucosamine-specific PTS transporter subunit IIBC [Succinivibrionaceae bacterium]
MMAYLQRLGKSLMLPVACLPVAGILMGVGYFLAPSTMIGGETEHTLSLLVGTFLVKAGGAVIDNMSVLFAVGVALGMSRQRDGTAALSGIVAWFVIQTLLAPSFVATLTNAPADPSFFKIGNQFVGILSGLIAATCYNRFHTLELPKFLAFFSGKRSVAIITAFVAILASLLLFLAWPLLYNTLIALGEAVISLGAAGAGIYTFLNRLLIPIGMHHALNAVFWFDVAGISDLTNFWSGKGVHGVSGMYMTGFFPVMMFGLPAAALAMYHCAPPERRRKVMALLASAAFCSFFTGITEPLEFAFMFLAPALYVVYALMSGLVAVVVVLLPIRAGFAFSAGFLDLLFSSRMPLAQNPWAVLLVGLAVFVIYYFVFRFCILHWNLRTPGRGNDMEMDEVDFYDPHASKPDANSRAARFILDGLGGSANILSCDDCATRIRVHVKDPSLVDESIIRKGKPRGIVRPADDLVQVVIGTEVQKIEHALSSLLERERGN